MSGPAGSGNPSGDSAIPATSPQIQTGFAGLVKQLLADNVSNPQENGLPNGGDVGPSRGLPRTGLKRNTSDYKEEEDKRRRDGRSGSQTSSGGIPSDAKGDKDGQGPREEREDGQEGAEGRGPGKHEKKLLDGGGYVESPSQEKDEESLGWKSTPPKAKDGQLGLETPSRQGQVSVSNTTPDAPTSTDVDGTDEDPFPSVPGPSSRSAETTDKGGDDDLGGRTTGDRFDPEEKIAQRDSKQSRRMTDEVGRYPDGLAGVKEEEPPGPRNEIILDPRISHLHVSHIVHDVETTV